MTRSRVLRRLAIIATLVAAFLTFAPAAFAAQDSKGTDFWLTFPGNALEQETKLFITGDTATTGTVSIPGLAVPFTAPFTVTPGTVTTVDLPNEAQLQSSDTVEAKGVHVTSAAEVTVYGLNRANASTDAYLGLPTDTLGKDYINLGWKNVDILNGSEFGIVATQNATTVTITPTDTVNGHAAGTPYTVTLDQGQTYLLRDENAAPADLSGTIITSNKEIAVFGGHYCANIPDNQTFACDHIVEELPPTSEWGKNFLSMPLATRSNGDTFRVLASENNTTVHINGSTVNLNRGQIHEQLINAPAQITADKPILVMQYSNGESFDNDGNTIGDPFEMMIPPFEQYLPSYTVSTPASGFDPNLINIVAPNSAVGSVKVDGTTVPAADFTPIGSSGFSGAQVPVAVGSHTVTSPQPIGVHSYGFGSADSYGYPGGLSLAQVATVASVSLLPKTATNQVNTQHCVTAHVTDSNGGNVSGVRVDFSVTGANPTSGFVFTDSSGNAQFCYTGTATGHDDITATVGTLSDTAAKEWVNQGPQLPTMSIDDVSGIEGPSGSTQTFTFHVTLSAASTGPVSVHFATQDGSANAPSDYLSTSGDLTFAPGETSKNVPVTVNGDDVPEFDEDFFVKLTGADGATFADDTGKGTILTDAICPPGATDPSYCQEFTLTLLAKKGVALVPVTCPKGAGGSCSGTVELRTVKKVNLTARKGAKRMVLGKARYKGIKAGKTKAVRIKLGKKAARFLKRHKKCRVDAITRGDKRARSVVGNARLGTYTLRYKRR
jgi:hypothetical protein